VKLPRLRVNAHLAPRMGLQRTPVEKGHSMLTGTSMTLSVSAGLL